jgi:hypothetical protein
MAPASSFAAGLAFQHYGRVDAAAFDALWPEIEQETAARLAASARPEIEARGASPVAVTGVSSSSKQRR